MRTKLALIFGIVALLTTAVAADDYIIQDNNQNSLFVVNQTGEKQIQNGNLFLNGNSIVDNQGALTLDGGNVEIPSGNLDLSNNDVVNVRLMDLSDRDGDGDNYRLIESPSVGDFRLENQGTGDDIIRASDIGNVEIPNGNLQMNGNEIQDVGALDLGWKNLTDYPTGCNSDEAVQVIGDTIDCTALEPGGAVNTTGANPGEVAFFIDNETVTGSSNFFWDNSNTELGIGTNTPASALDVNGQTNFRSTVYMNGNNVNNPGTVDGVHLDSPGNAISLDGSNQYQIASGAIGSNEIGSNAVTASGGELDSSIAGNQLGLNSGSLDVQDRWVDENGDTMSGSLNMSSNDIVGADQVKAASGVGLQFFTGGSGSDILFQDIANGNQVILRANQGGNVNVPNGNLAVSGNTDGVDIDNPGNGIVINSNQYAIDSNSVGTSELAANSVTDTELANSDSFTMNGLTVQGDTQIQGDLDVWGNITNTDVNNLNINGSLLPPSGYDATFDVGSSTRRWRDAYFSGTGKFDSGLTVSSGTVSLPNDEIDNAELNNPGFTTTTNSGIVSENINLGQDLTINHADTSTQSNINNSGGTIIQDLDFDGFGHVTAQTSYNLDNRYYTETESDSNFVDESGDTMSGSLTISNTDDGKLDLESTDAGSTSGTPEGGWNYIEFYDAQSDRQGYFGIDGGGNFQFSPEVSGGIIEAQSDLSVSGSLNMNSNSVTNFFGSNCASGEVVESVNADGTYNCISITGAADDTYVNEAGDTMTGPLNMTGDDIRKVGNLNASSIQLNGNDIGGLFVDESGDSMSGNLNMQGHHVDNLDFLELNSVGDIRVDGTDAIRLDSNQNVEVPNGDIQMATGNSIDDGSGDDRILMQSDNLRLDTGNSAGSGAVKLYDAANSQDILRANEGGNVEVPNGNLDLGTGQINNVGQLTVGNNGVLNSDGYAKLETGGGGSSTWAIYDANNSQSIALFNEGGNVQIPNGNLNVNNQLSVGSTECSTGSYIDGDGTCTSVSGSTDDLYVNEAGDTMTGNLNMNYNQVGNVSKLNVSTSADQIAHFSDTGVTISQPLSVESSGPLSVANGIDLTDGSSNTIDSYSTMYLQTSSGSPSDIVLDPTGEVGIDANTSITGDLDMQEGAIKNVNWSESDQGSGSGLNADTLDGVQLANIDWSNTALARNEVSKSDVGLGSVRNVDLANTGGSFISYDTGNENYNVQPGSMGWTDLGISQTDITVNDLGSADSNLDMNGYSLTDNSGTLTLGGGNVDVSSGSLTVNNQLKVGSTECSTGQYIDGDGTCTSVTGETSGEYVDETGDTMTGTLNMTSDSVINVGSNNIDIGDGQGNIAMNGQRIVDGGLTQVSGLGVTDSLSTAETEVSGNSIYVQNDVSVDGDFVGAGADVAEKMQNESSMESGTVVKISGNMSVDKTNEARDTAVAGVVSRDPAMIMAKERDGVPIAMSGTVPVKFSDENGGVKPGDFLTTASKKGHAMKCDEIAKCQGSIIGKAMQPQMETGEVEMMISRG